MTKPVYIFYGITPRTDGVLAQLVEHHNGIVGVKGSNPLGSTILKESVIFSGVMATIIRLVFLAGLLLAAGRVFPQSPASGPLWLHPGNPRYFADGNGKAVYLTGSHTWNNLPDIGTNRPPAAFDFDACLRLLTAHHHNFIRLWRWELTSWEKTLDENLVLHHVTPHPWKRSGTGNALDDQPRFNLDEFDEDYFARLRSRVKAAGDNGIYVAVMLFEGWGLQHITNAWKAHPFHRENNVNRVDGDINGDGVGIEIHTLQSSAVRELQERYVRKVVDTIQGCDNVLYEIANESGSYSTQWQYHFIRFIKDYEKHKPSQHPVGMTFQQSGNPRQRGMNQALYESPADWISPNSDADKFNYQTNPPSDIEGRVVLIDTDHLWGIGGDVPWVWKSFCRGLNPIFMDPYDHSVLGSGATNRWTDVRHAMGQSRRLAERLDLGGMVPRPELASSLYCLAEPRKAYVIYLPEVDTVSLDLRTDSTTYRVEWIQPVDGKTIMGESVADGAMHEFKKPAGAGAVLFLNSSITHAAEITNAPSIALGFPGDVGIERDPRVIFTEDFEEPSIDTLAKRWDTAGAMNSMSFTSDVPAGSRGKQSLLMDRQSGPGGQLYRRLRNTSGGWGYDRVFARYYVKFDPDCGEVHHFGTCLGGNYPATPWPSVKAGQRTDGAKSFWSGIEPFGSAWVWDFYTYWAEMRGSPPRGQTWGNSFGHEPKLRVEKGRWICVEQMIQMNDPNDSNGEQALWIDGTLISRLGKGFPKGRWTFDKFLPGKGGRGIRWDDSAGDRREFDVPEGGAPFEGFRWRTVPELNVNYVWLYVFTQKPAGHRIQVWFDHVVVATSYIGPISSAMPDALPR